ncbi:MAG TPA: formate dehydrogenase subunit delta [Chakrabartia sp.]|nr:formate dehydrogenase subunit delta [Chakrabartia sp.]
MTSLEKLVMMANQIAANLAHAPDPVAATADHIRLYWDPRMKAMIRGDSVTGLNDTARAAVQAL